MPLIHAIHRNLIVIGCGPHFRKRYYPVLEREKCSIALLIDLQANKEIILDFFKDKKVKPEKTLFLDEALRISISIEQIEELIAKTICPNSVDAVLLCTEPKVRKPYALWSLQHKLPLFMDKPPCAFSDTSKMTSLLQEYEEIVRSAENAKVNVIVSCERRAHVGYLWIVDYLRHFIQEEKVPITSIDIHFANGNWVTPLEYFQQEHHPFKYGYGLLLHSGYHYIDLLASLLLLNKKNEIDGMDYLLKVIRISPQESHGHHLMHCLSHSQDSRNSFFSEKAHLNNFGETDFLLIGQAKRRDQLISTFSVKLINTSLSKRTFNTPSPEAEWRLRQEHLIVHLSYLASLNVICNPLKKLDPKAYPIEEFNTMVMHSPLLRHRKPIVKMTRDDISNIFPSVAKTDSLNQHAREWQLKEFLYGRDGNSPLASHKETIRLLDLIYSQIYEEYIHPIDHKLKRLIGTQTLLQEAWNV